MNSPYYPSRWILRLVSIFILLATVSGQEQHNQTLSNNYTKVNYLLREEKAAIFAAFFGLMMGVIGFGIYFYEMYGRRYTDRYRAMNRKATNGGKADPSVSAWAR